MSAALAIFTLLLAGIPSATDPGSSGSRANIQFTVENPQLQPSLYSLVIYEDGSGSYTEMASGDSGAQPVKRAITIHDPLRTKLFSAARAEHFFATQCEAPRERVAFTGKKTLAYHGPDGTGSCTFNYSREQSLNNVAADLMSVAYTLEEGSRLQVEHRYDRLSLDSELESLEEAAKSHRALELENIAPELESIANDDAVMQRARSRARALMSQPVSLH